MVRGKFRMLMVNIKDISIKYLLFWGGYDLQIVHRDLLRLAHKQSLACQKASEFYLTACVNEN